MERDFGAHWLSFNGDLLPLSIQVLHAPLDPLLLRVKTEHQALLDGEVEGEMMGHRKTWQEPGAL